MLALPENLFVAETGAAEVDYGEFSAVRTLSPQWPSADGTTAHALSREAATEGMSWLWNDVGSVGHVADR